MTQFLCNSSPISQKGGVAVLCPVAVLGTFTYLVASKACSDHLHYRDYGLHINKYGHTVIGHGLRYNFRAIYPPFLGSGRFGCLAGDPAMSFVDCCGRQNTATLLNYREAFPNLRANRLCFRLRFGGRTFHVPCFI